MGAVRGVGWPPLPPHFFIKKICACGGHFFLFTSASPSDLPLCGGTPPHTWKTLKYPLERWNDLKNSRKPLLNINNKIFCNFNNAFLSGQYRVFLYMYTPVSFHYSKTISNTLTLFRIFSLDLGARLYSKSRVTRWTQSVSVHVRSWSLVLYIL